MVDLFGTPHTPALHVVERYQLLDHEAAKEIEEHDEEDNAAVAMVDNGIARDPDYKGKGLHLEFTVEDVGRDRGRDILRLPHGVPEFRALRLTRGPANGVLRLAWK
jgi:hypothetical protein